MYYQNNVQEIVNVEDHDDFIQNHDKCIMFFGSSKCKNCDSMITIFQDIARNYPQISFSHVEVTKTTVEDLGNSLPVVVCYKNNTPVGKVVGTDKNGIINMIQNNFQNSTSNKFAPKMLSSQNGRNNNLTMTEITDQTNFNKFISTNKKCLVFFGSEKCPHCRNIKPKIQQLVKEYPTIKFCHIEVTSKTSGIIPSQYRQSGLPLFICYNNGSLLDTVIGEDEQGVINMLEELNY